MSTSATSYRRRNRYERLDVNLMSDGIDHFADQDMDLAIRACRGESQALRELRAHYALLGPRSIPANGTYPWPASRRGTILSRSGRSRVRSLNQNPSWRFAHAHVIAAGEVGLSECEEALTRAVVAVWDIHNPDFEQYCRVFWTTRRGNQHLIAALTGWASKRKAAALEVNRQSHEAFLEKLSAGDYLTPAEYLAVMQRVLAERMTDAAGAVLALGVRARYSTTNAQLVRFVDIYQWKTIDGWAELMAGIRRLPASVAKRALNIAVQRAVEVGYTDFVYAAWQEVESDEHLATPEILRLVVRQLCDGRRFKEAATLLDRARLRSGQRDKGVLVEFASQLDEAGHQDKAAKVLDALAAAPGHLTRADRQVLLDIWSSRAVWSNGARWLQEARPIRRRLPRSL